MTRRNSHAFIAATALGIIGSAALAAEPSTLNHDGEQGHTLLAFHSMYGVDGPFVGDTFPLRGFPGDELPWTIASAVGRLDTDGHLSIQVRGLVFTDDEEVPPELRGINDEPTFRAAVSCTSEKGDQVVRRKVITEPFPATQTGNSRIRTTVELPNPCVAPTIFILAGSEDKWFAVVGFEAEEDEEE
jgi:hypothetical protein